MLLVPLCWLAMMATHELGHVLHAWASGGRVERVLLHPLAISRTDVAPNPHPQFVAWGGAIWGTLIPLGLWGIVRCFAPAYAPWAGFFAGFCCLANGLYLLIGSIDGVGDAGDLLRHGAARWTLWLLGIPLSLVGLWLWHRLGPGLGFRSAQPSANPRAVIGLVVALTAAIVLCVFFTPHRRNAPLSRVSCISTRRANGHFKPRFGLCRVMCDGLRIILQTHFALQSKSATISACAAKTGVF